MIFIFGSKKHILTVYKEKSFTKAAKKLYVSQPSLSATVKRVEETIGCPIFDRSTSPLSLTECGERYIQCIEDINTIENEFNEYLDDLKGLKRGNITIGGSNFFISYVAPPLITMYKKKYPSIDVDLIEGNTQYLNELLKSGTIDFLIMIDTHHLKEADYEKHYYCDEHLILVVPEHFPINDSLRKYQLSADSILSDDYLNKTHESVPLDLFRDENFILLKKENDTYIRSMNLCKENGFDPNVTLYLDQQSTAFNIVCSGLGISFISDNLIKNMLSRKGVVYYKLGDDNNTRHINFYKKKSKYDSYAIKEFINLIRG